MTRQSSSSIRNTLFALTIGTIALAACSRPDLATEGSNVKIANGDVVGLDDPTAQSTVALVQASPFAQGEFLPFCSGTLIEPDLVVTAAHCVSRRVLVSFGLGLVETPVVIAGRAYPHENFGALSSPDLTYDLAVIRLDEKAPDFMKPVDIALPSDFSRGDEVILAGYGRIVPKGSTFPTTNPGFLYRVSTRVSQVFPSPPVRGVLSETSSSTSTGRSGTSFDSEDEFTPTLFGLIGFASEDGRSGGCQGDSGGPMYLKKGDRLLLVGSTVGGPGVCAPTGYYSNLTVYAPWIRQAAERLAPQN